MLLARRELESNIAKAEAAYEAAVAARQESEWFKLDCQIKEESKRLAALNDEIEAIGQHLGSRPARQNAEEPSIFRDR